MATAVSKKRKPSSVASQILAVCKEHDGQGGVAQKVLESKLAENDVKSADMLAALNELMKKGKVVACPGMDKALVFRLQSDEDAAKMRDLTAEDRLVYQEIEQSQNKGASTKDLRSKTGLQAPALTKALKKLETRKLVRQVKSVASKNTKIYMLIDLEPGREITGGTWYSDDQEFDHELITHLRNAAIGLVQREVQATVAQVHEFINNSGLVRGKVLEPSDIEEILETLVSDARLECDKQLTGSGGGRALFEKLYRMRPSFAFIDDEVRAYTSVPDCACLSCSSNWRSGAGTQLRPCPAITAWLAQACETNAHW